MPYIVFFESWLGSGKSMGGLHWCLDLQDEYPDYVIYTNLKILDPSIKWKPLDINDLYYHVLFGLPFDDPHVILFFDEILNWFNARRGMLDDSLIGEFLLMQVRKRGCHLVATGTSVYHADVFLRNETNIVYKCSKRHAERPSQECELVECKRDHIFKYEYNDAQRNKRKPMLDFWLLNPEDYWTRFDSWDINPPINDMSIDRQKKFRKLLGLPESDDESDIDIDNGISQSDAERAIRDWKRDM